MGLILSGIDLTDLSPSLIFEAFAVIIVIYAVYKKLKELIDDLNADHERKIRWDKTADILKEKEKVWDDAVGDIRGERQEIVKRYDGRLDELEQRITNNHMDTEAKIQEVRADVMILAESIRAVLQGQIEQGCDGPVKEAKERLDHYLIESLGR